MDRAALRARIQDSIGETVGVWLSTSQLNTLIDEAQEVVAEELQSGQRTGLIPLEAGETFFSTLRLPFPVMVPRRLWTPINDRRLVATSMEELDHQHQDWRSDVGDPEAWFPVDWQTFGIWPKSASGGGLIKVTCIVWPDSMEADSDEPDLSGIDEDAIVLYAQYDALLKYYDLNQAGQVLNELLRVIGVGEARTFGRKGSFNRERAEANLSTQGGGLERHT